MEGKKTNCCSITRSLAQEPACKDLGRNGQNPAITSKATYTPAPKRASSRSHQKRPPQQATFGE
ncbi:alpha-galactosidase [Lacticaseibacillus casei]|nr:alpha-galactosidase [Lacticaseibacillus casei]NIG82935.1 alpha-galactosidase [Lacticaseibacillus casei]PTU96289.1 alpha-galactosidase [Lacticaseibacillus casei]PTU98658.1 alpha-galactosidase [Lacticaseibacillus casei]RXS57564.1 alpha-galactosidase [Lacticaseibacillus casei]